MIKIHAVVQCKIFNIEMKFYIIISFKKNEERKIITYNL